jgi:ribosomal protein L40E
LYFVSNADNSVSVICVDCGACGPTGTNEIEAAERWNTPAPWTPALEGYEMARIVDTDNFGRDYPDERFVVPFAMKAEDAETICRILNARSGPRAQRYYKVVEDDYMLAPGFEP